MPETYTHPDFAKLARHIAGGRSGTDRPLENNTRARLIGEDCIAIRLHNTDVVTINRDGTRELRSGHYLTVTTRDRISTYGSRYVTGKVDTSRSSSDGWQVKAEPDPRDPHPNGGERAYLSVPRPFEVTDPGPEPVDDGVGCIAGAREEFSWQGDECVFNDEIKPWDFVTGPPQYHMLRVRRSYNGGIVWGSSAYNYRNSWSVHSEDEYVDVPENFTYKQCPHCAKFKAHHARWDGRMNGTRYGRNSFRGYVQMCENLERYGSFEGWRETYREDLRAVKAINVKVKAWGERNWLEFYEGITVTAEGRVPLAAKRAHCKALEAAERERRRSERVHRRVRRQQAAIERKQDRLRKRQREVHRMVTEALANSVIAELEIKRDEYPIWKAGTA